MYAIISSANIDTFISSLPICIPLISFCYLIVLDSTSSVILNRYRKSGHPCLVSNFSGIATSMSPFNFILAVGLLYIAFIMFSYGCWIPDLSDTFNMKGYCILSNALLHLKRWSYDLFSFVFFNIVNYINGVTYIEPTLQPWDEAYLIVMNNGFDVFLDSVCKNFIECFWIDIHKWD
jgi:hypothetical protein